MEEAGKRQIYVILDMHGAPGSQNGSDHSAKDGGDNKEAASEFFFGRNAAGNQALYYKIWEGLAEHYKDNPWVAGYFNNLEAWDEGMALVNDAGLNWTTWTYKVVDEYGNWGIRNQKNANLNLETASLEEIKDTWSGVGESEENTGLRNVLEKYYQKVYIGQMK